MIHRTMTIDLNDFVVTSDDEFARLKTDIVTAVTLGGGLVELPLGEGMLSHSLLVTPFHHIEFIEREAAGRIEDVGPFPEL